MPAEITNLQVEHYSSPIGIETSSPRLSWSFKQGPKDWVQSSYEITVKRTGSTPLEEYSLKFDKSILVDWPSTPLKSREGALVTVRCEGSDGEWTDWISIYLEAGLLKRSDWEARPVSSDPQSVELPKNPFRIRHTFHVSSKGSARLYISALGLYEAYLNGNRIGDHLLGPGWTSYYARLNYQTFDITDLLRTGENVFGAWVGEGWYAGRLGYQGGTRNIYGERIALLAQLEVDGHMVASTGKENWEWSYGAVLNSEIYNGEIYDSNQPDLDWENGEWSPAEALELPDVHLVSSQAPPVRIIASLPVKEIITTPSGRKIIDFGQNFGGAIRLLSEPPQDSSELVIRHAEVLEDKELGTRPLRYAKATDRIVLGGRKVKGYSPRFTFHGFRYAEISGWPDLKLEDIEGVVLQSAMERTGTFTCSHELVNRLHKNCVWSTMANTISVPTDCPQRDERLGWTGDICVYAPTMSYLFDTSGFLSEWLQDLWNDQKRLNGIVPIFVPDTGTDYSYPEAIWGDAAVLTPYDVHLAYGDRKLLHEQFASIQLWLHRGVKRDNQTGLWSRTQDQLGDWLAPKASPETPNMVPTDSHLVADAWLIHSTKTAAKIASVIGEERVAEEYRQQVESLTKFFYTEYVTASGRVISDTQTALCLLLRFEIFPSVPDCKSPDYRSIFATRLAELVRRANWQVDTGFAGTPIILQTLAENGHLQHAYRMLQAKSCPSWLYCVELGATTIWERWDSMLSDGSINPGEMTSFNHYALGSVASFMHSYIGGLSPLKPGWQEILIKPQPGGTITSAETSHISPYGTAAVSWKLADGVLHVETEVPPNCTARVVLPGLEETTGSGKKVYSVKYEQPAFPPAVFEPHFAPVRPNEWIP